MKKLIFTIILLCLLVVGCTDDETKYTVTFDEDGGSNVSDITLAKNSNVNLPTTSKLGYDFIGWFLDDEKITSISSLDKDITLIAKWDVIIYSITYNLDGGINHSDNPTSYTIESVIELKNPQKEDLVFAGWYNGNTKIDKINNLTGKITLTARWQQVAPELKLALQESNFENNMAKITIKFNGATRFANVEKMGSTFKIDSDYFYTSGSKSYVAVDEDLPYEILLSGDEYIKRAYLVDQYRFLFNLVAPKLFSLDKTALTYRDGKFFLNQLINDNRDFTDIARTISGSYDALTTFSFDQSYLVIEDNFVSEFVLICTIKNSGGTGELEIDYQFSNYQQINFVIPEAKSEMLVYDGLVYEDSEEGISIISGSNKYRELVIPSFINDRPVVEIALWAFANTDITTITLPSSIKDIGPCAFYNSKLETIIFEENSQLASIGYRAFTGSNLKSITIPENVTSIANKAFENCQSLVAINVDGKNQDYHSIDKNLYSKSGYKLIQYATGKKEDNFVIPSSVYIINDEAFAYSNLKHISFEEGTELTTIKVYQFYGANIESITIPSTVSSIDNAAFSYCNFLTTINVDSKNQFYSSIDGNLYNITKDTLIQYAPGKINDSFVIPKRVELIENRAFTNTKVKTLSFESNSVIKNINDWAFYDSAITTITIPRGLPQIGNSFLIIASNLTTINVDDNNQSYKSLDGNLYNKDLTTLFRYAPGKTEENFIVPSSVINIFDYAFSISKVKNISFADNSKFDSVYQNTFGDAKIITINLPKSVNYIRDDAFVANESLQAINVSKDNQYYQSIDGNLYSKDGTKLIRYTPGKTEDSFIVLSSVVSITDYAFANSKITTLSFALASRFEIVNKNTFALTTIKNLTLPSSITHIGAEAFFAWQADRIINIKGYKEASQTWNEMWDFDCYATINWNA